MGLAYAPETIDENEKKKVTSIDSIKIEGEIRTFEKSGNG